MPDYSSNEITDCIIAGERIIERQLLTENIKRAARGFHDLGVEEGDAVALLLRNDFPFLEATEGASLIGAYAVAINWHFKGEEFRYILDDCTPKILVGHADLLAEVRDWIPKDLPVIVVPTPPEAAVDYKVSREIIELPPGATVWNDWLETLEPWTDAPKAARATMIYTSGTTGRPKGVKRDPATSEQVAVRFKLFHDIYGVRPGMRALICGPLYHASPNAFTRQSLGDADLLVLQSRFYPEETLAAIERYRITNVVMVPTMFARMLKLPEEVRRRYDLSSLKWAFHTAAPCPPEVKRGMIDWWGPIFTEAYGGTETGLPFAINSEDWLTHPGSVGRPTPSTEVGIYDEKGDPVAPGGIGEVYVRCHAYSDFTYHNQEGKRKVIERNGLISLGDMGYMKDGFLYICDRKADMVITGGVNIYPAETEAALLESPKVNDCAVFGVPDDDLGEILLAAVELVSGEAMTEDEVKAFVADRVAKYKVPRRVEFLRELPREDSGKVFKRKLRAAYWENSGRLI